MGRLIDLAGLRFGRLTVVERYGRYPKGEVTWLCKCDCGETTIVNGVHLRSGDTKSCGCITRETPRRKGWCHEVHGLSRSRLYSVYRGMKTRCYSKKAKYYGIYGGRGIKICDEWLSNFMSFYNWAVENGYEEGLSIDRIDNDGDYEPSNCRWATAVVQTRNRRKTISVLYNGEYKTIGELASESGLKYHVVYTRICRLNWDIDRALNTPVGYEWDRIANIRGNVKSMRKNRLL